MPVGPQHRDAASGAFDGATRARGVACCRVDELDAAVGAPAETVTGIVAPARGLVAEWLAVVQRN